MSAQILELIDKLIGTFQTVTPPVNSTVLRELYEQGDYATMLGWVKKSMRLNLPVGLRIVNAAKNSPPMWVETPGQMPLFGTQEFRTTRVVVNVRRDLLETKPFTWVVAGFAHELSHVVLFSLRHELQHDEKASDLTAMILGYQSFIANAEITKTEGTLGSALMAILLLPFGILFWGGTKRKTQRIGYLTKSEAKFAIERLAKKIRRAI